MIATKKFEIIRKMLMILVLTIGMLISLNSIVYGVQTVDGGKSDQGTEDLEQQIKNDKSSSGGTYSSNIISDAKGFLDKGKGEEPIKWEEITKNILPIANMLVAIASVVFVIVGMILGVKYMISGADERAGIKQQLIWFVVAMVLVYGAVGIYNIVVNVMTSITE